MDAAPPSRRNVAARLATAWLPRTLHPAAWWLWALGLATAASRTTNPVLLALILATICCVVLNRRGNAPWALAFRLYVGLAAFIVVMRVTYRLVFGGGGGSTVWFTLPEISLPAWTAGITLFGPVTGESLLGGFYDGLRLATMVLCVGAANALANPKRLLKAVPGALYEVGSAVVVALSVFPQLAQSLVRVRRARRLRGSERGLRSLRAVVIPVLEDAMDRSLLLAAAMDSRGYGRSTADRQQRRLTGTLMVAGLLGVALGIYATLDGSAPVYLGAPFLIGGIVVAGLGFIAAGRRVRRTRYRPDRWRLPEILVAPCGLTAGAVLYLTARVEPANLHPSLYPLSIPEVSLLPIVAILLGVLPAWLAPPPAASLPGVPP